jgi:glycosyltransferase involved in cell wall biosynthesis
MVAGGYPPDVGGVEAVVGQLTGALAGHGATVDVVVHDRGTPHPPATVPSGGRPHDGVRVERYPVMTGGHRFPVSPRLWRRLRRGQGAWDVIHAHSFHASPALAAALVTDRPLVVSPYYHGVGHTPLARALHVPYGRAAAHLFARAGAIICLSEAEADLLAGRYPGAGARIAIVPPGVDVEAIRAAVAFDTDAPVVLVTGRLEAYKQVDRLLRAMPHVRTDAVLVVVGGGPDRGRLRALADELQLGRRVRFTGRVDDPTLRRWQRTATVGAALSRHESFGLSLAEAVVAGAVAVASDVPAHREAAALAGATAVTFVPADVDERSLAEVLTGLLGRARGPARAGPASGALTWTAVAGRVLALYAEVA